MVICTKILGIRCWGDSLFVAIVARFFALLIIFSNLVANGQTVIHWIKTVLFILSPSPEAPPSPEPFTENYIINYNENSSWMDEQLIENLSQSSTDTTGTFDAANSNNADRKMVYETLASFCIILVCFSAVPLIHLHFLSTALFTRLWNDLWKRFQWIHRELELSEIFHRRCRKMCWTVFFLFFLVIYCIA